ncbi:MAG: BCD family MFS transporter [Hyphomicrobiaceae bacterium]
MTTTPLGWIGIVRLGLVQTALGAIIVLTTSTINRVMVVELALPAALPGALVGFHYALQFLRPRWGHGSDVGGRRTPWIIGGIAVLALGGLLAAVATALMVHSFAIGLAVAIAAFTLIGIGVGAAGTSLLALLATSVAPERRGAAATIVWLMMIAGFVVTAGTAGHFLDPFSTARLIAVTAAVSAIAVLLTIVAIHGIERRHAARDATVADAPEATRPFIEVLREVWADGEARRFTIFVFVSMLAYSMQDLILEPFAGLVYGLTPGESTKLAGVQHGGVFAGMVLVAVAGSAGLGIGSLRSWTIGGCIASTLALVSLALAGTFVPEWPLRPSVFMLGVANGAFAVAAIGSMMQLAGGGATGRTGVRMGLWGAAQAIAFGVGGFAGAVAVDALRGAGVADVSAFSIVFTLEAALFLIAAKLAAGAIVADGASMKRRRDGGVTTFAGDSAAGALR